MSNRAAVKRRIVRIAKFVGDAGIDLGLTGRSAEIIPVVYGLPPDTATRSAFYFGGIDAGRIAGRTDPAAISTTQPSNDVFVVKGTIDIMGCPGPVEADDAPERALNAFITVLHRCQGLVDKAAEGVPNGDSPDGPQNYKVQRAFLADWSSEVFEADGDTKVGRISFDIGCVTSTIPSHS